MVCRTEEGLCGAGKLKVLPAVNMTPVMAVRVRTVQMSAVLRVTMSPVLDDLPFIGGVALSFITQPYLDFDLRYIHLTDVLALAHCSCAQKLQSMRSRTQHSLVELTNMLRPLHASQSDALLCRLVAGPDIMSVPALASYMHASLMDVFVDQMIW